MAVVYTCVDVSEVYYIVGFLGFDYIYVSVAVASYSQPKYQSVSDMVLFLQTVNGNILIGWRREFIQRGVG